MKTFKTLAISTILFAIFLLFYTTNFEKERTKEVKTKKVIQLINKDTVEINQVQPESEFNSETIESEIKSDVEEVDSLQSKPKLLNK